MAGAEVAGLGDHLLSKTKSFELAEERDRLQEFPL